MGERLDEVIRVKKRPSNFVMMDKTFLEDNRLSFKAKGILAYLLSKPDNWKVITKNLVNASDDGEYSVYAGLKELKKYGYFEKVPVRNEQGTRIVRWESVVYEVPKSLFLENCEVENKEEKSLLLENQEIDNQKAEETAQNVDLSLLSGFCEVGENEEKSLFLENCEVEETERKSLLLGNQDIENLHVENLYQENHDRNNNYINNNNINNNYSYLSLSVKTVRKQIEYDLLVKEYPHDVELIDMMLELTVKVLSMKRKYIRINGDNVELKAIKVQFAKLQKRHIEYVLECMKSVKGQIENPEAYILTALYKAPITIDAYYAAKEKAKKQQQGKRSNNRFNNFHQRDYDADEEELEKILLSHMRST